MPNRKEEEPAEFKVVDRRLFTPEGELRTDLPPQPAPSAPEQKTTPPGAAASGPSPASSGRPAEPATPSATTQGHRGGPVQFEHLIMSLVTTAMYQLGMAARPGEPPPPPDLTAAQETIDLLGLLQEKTKGNLTRQEDELLAGSLQELRLVFVELARRAGRIR